MSSLVSAKQAFSTLVTEVASLTCRVIKASNGKVSGFSRPTYTSLSRPVLLEISDVVKPLARREGRWGVSVK